jgi:hypothetical protein
MASEPVPRLGSSLASKILSLTEDKDLEAEILRLREMQGEKQGRVGQLVSEVHELDVKIGSLKEAATRQATERIQKL